MSSKYSNTQAVFALISLISLLGCSVSIGCAITFLAMAPVRAAVCFLVVHLIFNRAARKGAA